MIARPSEARGGDAFRGAGNCPVDATNKGPLRREAKRQDGTSSGRART
jgi:hypothetical protein